MKTYRRLMPLALALATFAAYALEKPIAFMTIDEAGGGNAKGYTPDIVGLLAASGTMASAEAKRLISDGFAQANIPTALQESGSMAILFRTNRFCEVTVGEKALGKHGEGYVWSVLEEMASRRKLLAFCARLERGEKERGEDEQWMTNSFTHHSSLITRHSAELLVELTTVAKKYGAGVVGGGYFGPYGDSPAVRDLMARGWLDAQQAEPTAEATPTLTRVFFDPHRIESYEFRLGRQPVPKDISGLRPALFTFRLHDFRTWQKPPCTAKGGAKRMLERIASGSFDDAETAREVAYRPDGVGTVIDAIVDTRTVLQAFQRRRPDLAVLLQPMATDDADYDLAVNAEIVKFADGRRVRADGFAASYPKTYARTDISGTRGKWWWIDRVRANRDRIASEGGTYDVVMLGDSITHFWNDFDYWTGGRKVWERMQREMRLLNLGYGGDNTHNLLWRLRNGELEGYRTMAFQLLIGTNNYRDKPEVTAAEIGEIVRLIRAKHPESKIVLLSIFPRDDKPEYHALNQKVNAIIGKYADGKTVFHMDIGHVFLGEDGHLKRGISPDNDKLHLLDWGYELWWQAVAPMYEGFKRSRVQEIKSRRASIP